MTLELLFKELKEKLTWNLKVYSLKMCEVEGKTEEEMHSFFIGNLITYIFSVIAATAKVNKVCFHESLNDFLSQIFMAYHTNSNVQDIVKH